MCIVHSALAHSVYRRRIECQSHFIDATEEQQNQRETCIYKSFHFSSFLLQKINARCRVLRAILFFQTDENDMERNERLRVGYISRYTIEWHATAYG